MEKPTTLSQVYFDYYEVIDFLVEKYNLSRPDVDRFWRDYICDKTDMQNGMIFEVYNDFITGDPIIDRILLLIVEEFGERNDSVSLRAYW